MITSPLDIDDCVLWLKADAGIVTADAAGRVSEWTDQSGAGNDFVQTTPANQPHIVGDLNQGKRVTFELGGIGETAENNFMVSSMPVDQRAFSIFVVYRSRYTDSVVAPIFNNATGAGPGALLFYINDPVVFAGGGLEAAAGKRNAFLDCVGYCSDAAGVDIYSGQNKTTQAALPAGSTTYASLGRWSTDTVTLGGDILEVFAFDRKLTTEEQASVMEYMEERWGIRDRELNLYMIGDSIGAGYSSTENRDLVGYLERYFAGRARFLNESYNGYAWSSANYTAEAIQSGQENVFLGQMGINDIILEGNSAAQAYADSRVDVANWTAAGWRIVMFHLLPQDPVNATVEQYNALISDGPDEFITWDNIPQIVDHYADGLHPLSPGYELMAAELYRQLNPMISGSIAAMERVTGVSRSKWAEKFAGSDPLKTMEGKVNSGAAGWSTDIATE